MDRMKKTAKRVIVFIMALLLLAASAFSGTAFKTLADEGEAQDLTRDFPVRLNLDDLLAGLENESFSFELTSLTEDAPIPEKTKITFTTDTETKSFTDSFGPVTFPKPADDQPVTYEYEIVQTTADKDCFVLDRSVYKVTVFVYLEYSYEDGPEGRENVFVTIMLNKEGEAKKPAEVCFENSLEPEYVSIEGTKKWNDADDQDGFRPDSIVVHLLADGKPVLDENGEETTQTVRQDDSGSWSFKFEGLEKYSNYSTGKTFKYTVEESPIQDEAGNDIYSSKITEKEEGVFQIINTHEPEVVTISGKKTWNDADDQDGLRPSQITLQLFADGEPYGDAITVKADESGNWTYEFKDLPKYKEGKEIVYSIQEEGITGYNASYDGFDITNKHKPGKTGLQVRKVWVDGDDQDGIRPDSIQIQLLANGEPEGDPVAVKADEKGNWSYEWTGLPEKKDGKKIIYTVAEIGVDGYKTVMNGDAESGILISNEHKPETIEIPVRKEWNDGDDQDGIRPPDITVKLFADGIETKTAVLSESNGWAYEFKDLPKYKEGTEIVYSIQEEGITGYNASYEGFDITNTHIPGETSLQVRKVWVDADDQDGIRPDSIQVQLLANGEPEGKPVTVKADEKGNWSYEWTGLPENKDGKKIIYSVAEVSVEGYKATISGDAESGILISNEHEPETIEIPVRKEWNDGDDQDGIRPPDITVKLFADGTETNTAVLSESNGWAYEFKDLPKFKEGKEIVYSVAEIEEDGYKSSITEEGEDGFKIVNTHEPEVISISGKKTWKDEENQDGLRPSNITIQLQADGEPYGDPVKVTADKSGNWTYEFKDLPKYKEGKEIIYSVQEEGITGYNASYDGLDITNTHKPGETSLQVRKVWVDADDQDGIRPDSIQIQLLANGEPEGEPVTVKADEKGNWSYEWTGLPEKEGGKKIVYTVAEVSVDGYKTVMNGDAESGILIRNEHEPETIEIPVRKEWDDRDNQDGIRPGSISVKLLADGVETKTAVLSESNGWAYEFKDLPKFKAGKEIVYSVAEIEEDGYKSSIAEEGEDGFKIVNTHEPEVISISGKKTWDDADDRDGLRHDTVTVNLLAGDEIISSVQTSAEEDWAYEFKNLPKYKEGKEIVYSVQEEGITGYNASYNGFDITNTHKPGETSLQVRKVWDDAEDQDGIRPDFIQIQLLADGEPEGEAVTVKADHKGNWSYEWTGLPENKDGEKIIYTVAEIGVDGYKTTITGDAESGFLIQNEHEPEKTRVPVNKKWEDANDKEGKRPSAIIVKLFADGIETKAAELSETNGWAYEFKNLPKYKAGKEIQYTIEESPVKDMNGKTLYRCEITGDAQNGFTVINTFDVPKTGDNSPLVLYITLMGGAALLIILVIVFSIQRRRKMKKQQ